MAESRSNLEIKTYILFDLETTGLPSPGNNPRITEISLLAYSDFELQTKTQQPRICNKLTLCIDPCRPISPRASNLTGLYNDALDGLPTFKKQAPLIISFLNSLPAPCCLVAHNGNNFDFPLLKAELKRIQLEEDINDILIADSIAAFRSFYNLPPYNSKFLISSLNMLRINENAEDKTQGQDSKFTSTFLAIEPRIDDLFVMGKEHGVRKDESSPEKTQHLNMPPNPVKRGSRLISHPESSAKKRLFEQNSSTSSSEICREHEAFLKSERVPSDSALPESKNVTLHHNTLEEKIPTEIPKSFSLPNLYRHYFQQEPDNSHAAENDCITLMKIIRINCQPFFFWCNQNACQFKNIKPMY